MLDQGFFQDNWQFYSMLWEIKYSPFSVAFKALLRTKIVAYCTCTSVKSAGHVSTMFCTEGPSLTISSWWECLVYLSVIFKDCFNQSLYNVYTIQYTFYIKNMWIDTYQFELE